MSESRMNESQAEEQTDATATAQVSPAPEDAVPVQSPGALLAARREELGLPLERVAEQLKMTPRRVLEIEADNFSAVHSKAIYRGFVRAYAKVLKMDPEPLVAMITDEMAQQIVLTPTRNRSLETFSETHMPFIAKFSIQSKRMGVAIVLVALLICVLLAQKVGWIPSLPKATTARVDSAPASTGVAVASSEAVAQASASAAMASSAAAVASSPTSASAVSPEQAKQASSPPVAAAVQTAAAPPKAAAPVVAVVQPTPPAAAKGASAVQPAPAGNGKNVLVLKCREESWVELKRTNGAVVASRYVPAGTTARFTISEPMQLTIGNAPAVEATLRGVRLNIYAAGDSKVVRMNVK